MKNLQNISDISKETLTFLGFFDDTMIEKIPSYFIAKLCEEAADSKLDFYVDANKSFEEQDISEQSKDLISLIYYDYIAEEEEKQGILKQWMLNEKNYQDAQKEKYNLNNLSRNKETPPPVEMIETKKETLFQKIQNFFKSSK